MDKTPVVGMGATKQVGSDSYPFIVTKVVSATTIEVERLEAVGEWGKRTLIEPDMSKAIPGAYRLRKNSRGIFTDHGTPFYIGVARLYLDPSF